MPRQKGSDDCGLFALAYAIEICQGKNPANLIYNQLLMRSHFNTCIKNDKFTNFPSMIQEKSLKPKTFKFNAI